METRTNISAYTRSGGGADGGVTLVKTTVVDGVRVELYESNISDEENRRNNEKCLDAMLRILDKLCKDK